MRNLPAKTTVLLAALTGCAAPPPPPPPPTLVNITLKATADVNATPDGHGAPVVIRVYQLASAAGFTNAEFFPLYKTDAATLGNDLTQREDITLNPGQTSTDALTPKDTVKSIAIFGGFRDYQHVAWRASTDIPPHLTTNITITAGPAGIVMDAKTLPPPPPPKPGN